MNDIQHRRPPDIIDRLQSFIIAHAEFVADVGDVVLYRTHAGRWFVVDAGGLRPVTPAAAAALLDRARTTGSGSG